MTDIPIHTPTCPVMNAAFEAQRQLTPLDGCFNVRVVIPITAPIPSQHIQNHHLQVEIRCFDASTQLSAVAATSAAPHTG